MPTTHPAVARAVQHIVSCEARCVEKVPRNTNYNAFVQILRYHLRRYDIQIQCSREERQGVEFVHIRIVDKLMKGK